MEPIINPQGAGPAAPLVVSGSTGSFGRDVIEGSAAAVVIVDFWAPWCEPCKQLGPALERAVTAARGAVRLVKINIDENPELAQELRIQSIPAVFAFHQGQPVDGFVGALPESQIKAFVERLARLAAPAAAGDNLAETLKTADSLLGAGDGAAAAGLYQQVLETDPGNAAAIAGLVRCELAAGNVAAARQILDAVTPELDATAEIGGARTALELAERRPASGAAADLEARLARDANDHQARFDLAQALFAEGAQEAAIDQLIEIIRRARSWNDEAARKELLTLFEALGPTHPLTESGRRRLSSVLFS